MGRPSLCRTASVRCGPSSRMELSRSSSRMIALFAVRAFVTVRPDTERFTVGVSLGGLALSPQPTGSATAKQSNAWRTLDVRGTFATLKQNLILRVSWSSRRGRAKSKPELLALGLALWLDMAALLRKID